MALPCSSAKRSRLFPEAFDDCSLVGRKLSPRDGAIITELNESAFALNFLETGEVLVILSHVKKWEVHHTVH